MSNTTLEEIGIAANGIPIFNPWYNIQDNYLSQSRDSLKVSTFSSCCGHPSGPQSGQIGAGPYHYHKYPTCVSGNKGISPSLDIIEEQDMADILDNRISNMKGSNAHSPIIGYMRDGYPIYGPLGVTTPIFDESMSV